MGTEHIGRSQSFGLSIETSRGTAKTTVSKWVRKVQANIIPKADRKIDDSSFGRLEDAERVRTVRKWNEGDLEGIIHADVLGYLLANIYGAVDSDVVSGSIVDHVFTLDQTITHPTLTLFVKDGDVRQAKIAGSVVSKLEINVATDDYLRFKASFTGKEESADTSDVSYDDENDFVSRDVTMKMADTEAGLSGADAIKVKNLSLTLSTGMMVDYVFGSYSPNDIYNGKMAIEGKLTKNFVDTTFEDLFKGQDAKYVQITIEGEADLGSGNHPTVTILLNKVMVTDWNRTDSADALVTEEVSFKAFYNVDDEQQSKITLRNLTASYLAGS